jgi:nicotinamide-nucleotide amidase
MGTAPGMWFDRNGKVFISMPGVPHEMKRMMTDIILPKLQQTFQTPIIQHTVIRTVGIGESFLAEKIAAWENALPAHIKLAYLPSLGEVKLRLTAFGADKSVLEKESLSLVNELRTLAGEYIFGVGEDSLEVVLGKTLREKKLTLSLAESCTGGFLSQIITSVPGCSDYFVGSLIPYAYAIKTSMLGVEQETLNKFGAVSEETIREMANNVRTKFNTDIGVATSGIAGPGGGTDQKPVGTIWIAYADKHQTVTKKLQLSKDRTVNIRMASVAALNLIRLNLPSSQG